MRRTVLSAAALSVAALTLTQLAPATADGIGVSDPDDLAHGVDLLSVEVEDRSQPVRAIFDPHGCGYCATQSVKERGAPSQSVLVVAPLGRVPATRTATRTSSGEPSASREIRNRTISRS